jgi:hypothetical protein
LAFFIFCLARVLLDSNYFQSHITTLDSAGFCASKKISATVFMPFLTISRRYLFMKPIHFRGINYDPVSVSRAASQGYRVKVATGNVLTVAAAKDCVAKVAVQIDGKYHLLTGNADLNQPEQDIIVISVNVLDRCAEETSTFSGRQTDRARENEQSQRRGKNQYSH